MSTKSDKWIDASLGIRDKSKRKYLTTFNHPNCIIKGTEEGYKVFSLRPISAGQVIEEVPALVLHTTVEDLQNSGNQIDPILSYHTIEHPMNYEIFEKEGRPLILGLGNFSVYRKNKKPNASYTFDPNFNLITIRALYNITTGEEITLEDVSQEKMKGPDMGCGCKKNKKSNNQPTEKKLEPKPAVGRQRVDGPKQNLVSNNKFKSMSGGGEFKSIQVD